MHEFNDLNLILFYVIQITKLNFALFLNLNLIQIFKLLKSFKNI